jgi:hypothetical protein
MGWLGCRELIQAQAWALALSVTNLLRQVATTLMFGWLVGTGIVATLLGTCYVPISLRLSRSVGLLATS